MAHKILLIDDEKDFNELTSTMLSFYDFDVRAYDNPAEIMDTVENESYDLIVTDLMMPNMDGFHFVEKIRSMEKYKETPIIVLTAKTLNNEERKFLLQKNVHLLGKPFEPQGLVDQIRNLVNT